MGNKTICVVLVLFAVMFMPLSGHAADKPQDDAAALQKDFLRELDREPIGSAYKEGQNEYSRGVYLLKGESAKPVIDGFNRSLKKEKKGGDIYVCRSVIEEPVGHGHNSQVSYGGVCLYREKGIYTPVRICNDNIVGHFKMESFGIRDLDFDGSLWKLTKFVFTNCAGG